MKSRVVALPYIIWMMLFTVLPMGLVAYMAFTDKDGGFTMANLSNVSTYTAVIFRSIWMAAVATVICLILAYPLSYIISRLNARRQRMAIMLVMLPMWMNFLLRTYAWMTLLENTGLINKLLGVFGIGPFRMINTDGAVILGMVYNYLPFMILPLYSILSKIDEKLIHAGQDLGANGYNVFSKIILPISVPGIMSGITLVFVPSVSTFAISQLLGGGTNLLIGDVIQLQFYGNAYNPNLGAAISLGMMILILLCMSMLNQFDEGREEMLI